MVQKHRDTVLNCLLEKNSGKKRVIKLKIALAL